MTFVDRHDNHLITEKLMDILQFREKLTLVHETNLLIKNKKCPEQKSHFLMEIPPFAKFSNP